MGLTLEEAERQRATLLCALVNLRERDRANLAPECSDVKLKLVELDLERAERRLTQMKGCAQARERLTGE